MKQFDYNISVIRKENKTIKKEYITIADIIAILNTIENPTETFIGIPQKMDMEKFFIRLLPIFQLKQVIGMKIYYIILIHIK